MVNTYSEVPPGALLALEGSHGYLEFACREGSAAEVLGAGVGTRVEVYVSDLNPRILDDAAVGAGLRPARKWTGI